MGVSLRHASSAPPPMGEINFTQKPTDQRRSRRARATEEVIPEHDFPAESKVLFDTVHQGLKGMEKINDVFVVNQTEWELTIDLGKQKGTYTLLKDVNTREITLLSPISGLNKYAYDAGKQRWLSVGPDKHDFLGILTRDLIRQCTGCPSF